MRAAARSRTPRHRVVMRRHQVPERPLGASSKRRPVEAPSWDTSPGCSLPAPAGEEHAVHVRGGPRPAGARARGTRTAGPAACSRAGTRTRRCSSARRTSSRCSTAAGRPRGSVLDQGVDVVPREGARGRRGRSARSRRDACDDPVEVATRLNLGARRPAVARTSSSTITWCPVERRPGAAPRAVRPVLEVVCRLDRLARQLARLARGDEPCAEARTRERSRR